MTQDEARALLKRAVAADVFPTLDGPAIDELLRNARRPDASGNLDEDVPYPPGWVDASGQYEAELPRSAYDIWAPSTVYAEGDVVVPAVRNGFVYTCIDAGTSDSGEPAWDTEYDGLTTDGSVTWQTTLARVWQPTYDLNAAAAEGWRWKAARVTDRFGYSDPSGNYNPEQVYQHCMDMAKHYTGKTNITLETASVRTRRVDLYAQLPRA